LYFARTDSIIERISVHSARIHIGRTIAHKMLSEWSEELCNTIDVIVPVPDTSITFANGIQDILGVPVREGFVKNRYIDRTFIMQNQQLIQKSIKRKLCGIPDVFRNKCVLIVDDSIVRGNTSAHIVQMAREYGAKKVFFVSCSPIVRDTNEYGIYIPTQEELVSYQRTQKQICEKIGVDYLIFHDLHVITGLLKQMNGSINDFETSMFHMRYSGSPYNIDGENGHIPAPFSFDESSF
jgi:amidophosphoribosyltransferase